VIKHWSGWWFQTLFIFHNIWWDIYGIILPIDFHIFQGARSTTNQWSIELDDGKIYRKALYLMVKTMVSCRFSLKPIQWTNQWFFMAVPQKQNGLTGWPPQVASHSAALGVDEALWRCPAGCASDGLSMVLLSRNAGDFMEYPLVN